MIAISKCMLRYLCNIFIVVVGIYLAEKLKGELVDQQLIGYRERNHDETRDEIGHGQAEDEDGGRPLVPLPVVDQEGKRVSCLSRGKRTFKNKNKNKNKNSLLSKYIEIHWKLLFSAH